METIVLKIKRLRGHSLPLPKYESEGASGLDLSADLTCHPDRITSAKEREGKPDEVRWIVRLIPGERMMIDTGLAFEIPYGYEGMMRPRSGKAYKDGLTLINSPGTIDSDYRGEVRLLVVNLNLADDVFITHGERIAQLVIQPVVRAAIVQVQELSESKRGTGGYGSTGTH